MSTLNRHQLEHLAQTGQLSAQGLEIALARLNYLPDARAWRRFADLALLAGGGLLALSGVVFFFAFNWEDLHRFTKQALVALPLLLSALLAVRLEGQRAGQAWLGAAVVLVGVLLAVLGQIYQTGADSELLFADWALLALPWVVAGCMAWLWLFWLLLLNVALSLFLSRVNNLWLLHGMVDFVFWAPLLLNAAALSLWEFMAPRVAWLRVNYAPRMIAAYVALCATVVMVSWIFQSAFEHSHVMRYTPMLYLVWLGTTLWFYRMRRHDIVPLAMAALSLVAVLTCVLIRWMFKGALGFGPGTFLFIGLAIAGMTTLATLWLRQTVRAWEAPSCA